MPENREEIVSLRDSGKTWPQVAKESGFSRATVQKVYKEAKAMPVAELDENRYEKARVLGPVPNPRLMRIYFEHKEGVGICVKRPHNNHPPKSEILVKRVEGEEKLYRLV
jgi:hypothetical protein